MGDAGVVWVTAYVVAGEPDLDHQTECSTCGYQAVVTFPLYALTPEGVSPFGEWAECVRCWIENHPDEDDDG